MSSVAEPSPNESPKPIDTSGLSLEAQFAMKSFETLADKMTREQAIEAAKTAYFQVLAKDHYYRKLFKINGLQKP